MSAAAGNVGPASYVRPPLSRPEKYERLAFTFCRMGTVGLIAWLVTPAVFVLVVAVAAIVEKHGPQLLSQVGKIHFRTAHEVAPEAFPAPPPKRAWVR